jgi:hypothetical protein
MPPDRVIHFLSDPVLRMLDFWQLETADRDGERRIAHAQVHAFSPETTGHLRGDFLHTASSGPGFHQQAAKFQR